MKQKGRITKQQLLEKGLEIIVKQGFNKTGLQQILAEANVPKGSFYHYFKSKEDFGLQVVEFYAAQSIQNMATHFESDAKPLERLRNFFESAIDMFGDPQMARGCLIGNMSQEMGSLCPAFEALLEKKWRTMREYLTDCLDEARINGELVNGESSEELADFLMNAWQGALMRMKVARSTAPLRNFVGITFNGLLQQPATAIA